MVFYSTLTRAQSLKLGVSSTHLGGGTFPQYVFGGSRRWCDLVKQPCSQSWCWDQQCFFALWGRRQSVNYRAGACFPHGRRKGIWAKEHLSRPRLLPFSCLVPLRATRGLQVTVQESVHPLCHPISYSSLLSPCCLLGQILFNPAQERRIAALPSWTMWKRPAQLRLLYHCDTSGGQVSYPHSLWQFQGGFQRPEPDMQCQQQQTWLRRATLTRPSMTPWQLCL